MAAAAAVDSPDVKVSSVWTDEISTDLMEAWSISMGSPSNVA